MEPPGKRLRSSDHEMEIDDSLYSRQRYVLGDGAMQRMAHSNVLVIGMGGVGIEIAKNMVLAGVKSVTVHDVKSTTPDDLGTQFFLEEKDIGMCRASPSQSKLAELNPYVAVKTSMEPLDFSDECVQFLLGFQCIVATDMCLKKAIEINKFCRNQKEQIGFIYADVVGVFSMLFVDLGMNFQVVDSTGEDLKECFISDITNAVDGIVTVIDNHMHNLEDGDHVTFREVEGMTELNGKQFVVKVIGPAKFSIGDTSKMSPYKRSGIASQLHRRRTIDFMSMEEQISKPTMQPVDFGKFENPNMVLLGFRTLNSFQEHNGRLPAPWKHDDAAEFLRLANIENESAQLVEKVDEKLLKYFSYTCAGSLAPLCAVLGGIAAQETLKALTGKFTPLQQLMCMDMVDVCPELDSQPMLQSGRYNHQTICLGQDLCNNLANVKLFMVGCGAIGCEMLKNYALLGVGTGHEGKLILTDNDIIEKSNLNRQFLFRPEHIQQPKSTIAAKSAKIINPELKIEAHQSKVGPETTATTYTDEFFQKLTLVVNALDNLQTRLFMDACCVRNQRALLESGTMGTKGHVQVIVPHLTESYASQRDPPEQDVPYCTLKSFPNTIEHTIQWARDKFANLFELKPADFNKFWGDMGSVESAIQACKDNDTSKQTSRIHSVLKMVRSSPATWNDCIGFARAKFEKYFNHKARHLLDAFPIDTVLKDGTLFWQSPKRPPSPLDFNIEDPNHAQFVLSTAKLVADRHGITYTDEDTSKDNVKSILSSVTIPAYKPKTTQNIVTDDAVTKQEAVQTKESGDILQCAEELGGLHAEATRAPVNNTLNVAIFEKDVDENGHIDFITAASNLRAVMYGISPVDRFKTKLIAGKIVPAIATTTAAVAGLASIELIKLVKDMKLEEYRNAFLNLALPFLLLTEPGPAEKLSLAENVTYTLWDRWEIHGTGSATLQDFLDKFKATYNLTPNGVFCGNQMVFASMLPDQKKKLGKLMRKLLKSCKGLPYADLSVTLEEIDESRDDHNPPPSVRYFFHRDL
eukprot:m.106253 g.106253  ORF g.106253 m.106253 type:complete len:1031 (+) comp13900_c0_seq4:341-3433(+)